MDDHQTQAIGLSRDLPAGRAMRAEVNGHDLVVWRAMSGSLAAWDNRCPHRGMRLSHGFVRGNRLACLYHGWHYETSGRCGYIPAHPELDPPATIQTVAHPVLETDGVIWVNTTGPVAPAALPAGLVPLRSLMIQSTPDRIRASVHRTPFQGTQAQVDTLVTFGATSLALLLNPQTQNRCQISVLTSANAELATQRALSRWCEALRATAETTPDTGAAA